MTRALMILLALLVAAVSASEQKPRRQRNHPPTIDSFTSSATVLRVCTFHPELYDKPQVDLLVKATDPDGDALQYEYSTTGGTVLGKGKLVVWDLKDAIQQQHEVRVTVTDGKGGKAEASLKVAMVDGGSCDPPPPPCPWVKVTCPSELVKTKPFVFSAVIEGNTRNDPPSFYWKLDAGRIVKGQHGAEIEATTTGANGFDSITATVEVGGFDPSCNMTARCTTRIIW